MRPAWSGRRRCCEARRIGFAGERSDPTVNLEYAALEAAGSNNGLTLVRADFNVRQQMVDLALQHRLATSYGAIEYAEAGALIAYSVDYVAAYKRAASLIDQILKGASPASTPVEQINVYELVINLRTARVLGIDLPKSLLIQATRVIE